jgi:hypothetical protein
LNLFLSRSRPALLAVALLAAAANSGCSGGVETDSHVTGAGGSPSTGGAGGGGVPPACPLAGGTVFAEIEAPAGKSLEEIAIAATDTEVGVAYTQWNEATHDVTVLFQRYSLDGHALGEPKPLHTFNECCGQLAAGDFYGRPTLAATNDAYAVCWSEAAQIGCSIVSTGGGEPSFLPIGGASPAFSDLYLTPTVAATPGGFRVFYDVNDGKAFSTALAALDVPVEVPGSMAVAIPGGFVTVSRDDSSVSILAPDLSPTAAGPMLPGRPDAIAAFGNGASTVSGGVERRIDGGGNVTEIPITSVQENVTMAVTARGGGTVIAWVGAGSQTVGWRAVAAAGTPGPEASIGCALGFSRPSIAVIPGAVLIAAPLPEGAHEAFYAQVVPRLRITRVPAP